MDLCLCVCVCGGVCVCVCACVCVCVCVRVRVPSTIHLSLPPCIQLAQMVVDAGAVAHLAGLISSQDAKLKRQVFSALSQISKHSVDLAEMVVEAEVFPAVLTSLKGTHTASGSTMIELIPITL